MVQKILELNEKMEKITQMGWIRGKGNSFSSSGIVFENLLGIETNNLEIPDFHGIEIKTKIIDSEPFITLFNATPDSYLFEIKRLQEIYGYPDKKLAKFKVLNISVYGNKSCMINNKYLFKLKIDKEKQSVILQIYNNLESSMDTITSWTFGLLEEKLMRKLSYLAVISVQKKMMNGVVYFKYTKATFLKIKDFNCFLELIKQGIIRVTFKISVFKSGKRYGQIHDHGTSFDIKECDLQKLFSVVNIDSM